MLVFPSTSAAWSYFGSIAVLLSIYYFFAHVYSLHHETAHEASEGNESVRAKRVRRKAKTRSWIITATSSAVMTVGSVPFVWDLVCALGDVAMVRRREWLSEGLTSFFLAYLLVVSLGFASASFLVGARTRQKDSTDVWTLAVG